MKASAPRLVKRVQADFRCSLGKARMRSVLLCPPHRPGVWPSLLWSPHLASAWPSLLRSPRSRRTWPNLLWCHLECPVVTTLVWHLVLGPDPPGTLSSLWMGMVVWSFVWLLQFPVLPSSFPPFTPRNAESSLSENTFLSNKPTDRPRTTKTRCLW